ncbi:MAG TPA: EF-hand domain-containing protein [Sphingomicrobium sp.]|nr:EF-hand domain-containing protein [Sphingomicrobium sp.]
MPLFLPLILSFAATAAQSPAGAAPAPVNRHWGRLFISPMGEPFRARGHADDPLADWFAQADRKRNGCLTLDEMQQDAERFFKILDVNHDGELDPEEISRYEDVVAPEIQSGPRSNLLALDFDRQTESSDGRRGGQKNRGSGRRRSRPQRDDNESHQGAARFGLLDLPEPVISADTDFDRGVSLAEFRAAAAQRFIALDIDHKACLTLTALENIRPEPAAEQHKSQAGDDSGMQPPPGD